MTEYVQRIGMMWNGGEEMQALAKEEVIAKGIGDQRVREQVHMLSRI